MIATIQQRCLPLLCALLFQQSHLFLIGVVSTYNDYEGDGDVVGVVTPLVRGGAQVVLHGDQVVELSVLLGVHEKGEVGEDGEGQVEVEREEGEIKEKRSWMTMRMM